MNVKLAKRLRKAAGYHPSQETELHTQVNPATSRRPQTSFQIVDPESPKAQYKAMKKEYKNGYVQ